MEQWTNSNNRRTVTDGPFAMQICRGCMVDHKKKNPYWSPRRCMLAAFYGTESVRSLDRFLVNVQSLSNYSDV